MELVEAVVVDEPEVVDSDDATEVEAVVRLSELESELPVLE